MTSTETVPNLTRLVVAAPMKSGSTYISHVLGRYFGIQHSPEVLIDWFAEPNLVGWVVPMRETGYSYNLHLLPHMANLAIARHEGISIVVGWRNLGDMLLSFDEHILRHKHNPFTIFIQNHEKYGAMSSPERHTFMIDTVAPWYIGFYLRWRSQGVVLYPYEQMLLDQRAFFARVITDLTGQPPSEARLSAALAPPPNDSDRFNVGRFGRSAEKFGDAAKRQLEDKIFTHPDRQQLEILLWELPWEVPRLERRSPLDGQVLKRASDGVPFFVSCGTAHQITQLSWLLSRTGERRTPRLVDDAELAGCALGDPLV